MNAQDTVSVAIGVLNALVALLLIVHIGRLGFRPPLPLVLLAAFFGVRAAARLVPPLGEEPDTVVLGLDMILLLVLVTFAATASRLVATFVHERDALQRKQVDYDDALFRHETTIADAARSHLDDLHAALANVEASEDEASRAEALARARESLRAMRG